MPGSSTPSPTAGREAAVIPTSGRGGVAAGSASPRTSIVFDWGPNIMQNATIEQARASDSDILQELNRNFIRSVQMSDVRWFDQNLSEDFLNSNGDGSLSERADFLLQIGRPCPVSNLCAEDVRIRILGEIAIVHGRTTYIKP